MRIFLLCLLTLLSAGPKASADVIYSNFGPGNSYDVEHGPAIFHIAPNDFVDYQAVAARFTVRDTVFYLTSVDAAMRLKAGTESMRVYLSIAKDNDGEPGTVQETVSVQVGSDRIYPFAFSGTTLLNPANYWIVATSEDTGDRNLIVYWDANNQGGYETWRDHSGVGEWNYNRDATPVFRVYGTPGTPTGPTGPTVPTLTWSNPEDITYGTPLGPGQLNATASVPGSLDYTPPAGTILSAGARQVLKVTFTPWDENHIPTTASVRINVLKAASSITWPDPADITYGTALGDGQLNAAASADGRYDYLPQAGTVLPAGAGQTLTVIFTPDDANYATATNSVHINVAKAAPSISWPNPVDITYGSALGAGQLNATASVEGRFVYTPPVGTVLPVGAGQVLTMIYTPDDANHTTATNTVRINVVKATPLISWTNPVDITYGTALGSGQLNATASVLGTFLYTPGEGTVLPAGAEQVLRVAFSPGDANYAAATTSVRINVLKAVPLISWTNPVDITYGTTLGSGQLNATANVLGTFLYTPGEGTVLPAGADQELAVAFAPTDTNYAAAAASVRVNVLKAAPSITWTNPVDITYGTALGSGQLNATANVLGTFLYTPGEGTVLPAGADQELAVAFAPTDTNYAAAAASVRVNVLKAAPSITWTNPVDITYGTALGEGQLNATASVSGRFDYTPPAGTVLLAGAEQVLSVAFSPSDANFSAATASVRVNVLKATPSIAWTNPADITYGTALGSGQLNATASVPGSFLYTPGEGTVLPAGAEQELSVAFSPTDTNYAAATVAVRINVLQAAPTITWTNPADITYGTLLGVGQLNATSSVPGNWLYSPADGTMLQSGLGQTLAVAFAPTDTNYRAATVSVRVNVLQAAPSITWANPVDITYGAALGNGQLNATASVPGSFLYTPGEGTVLPAGAGQVLSVAFSPTDTNYTSATASVRVNVLKATPSIAWTNPADITYGTALGDGQLNATASIAGRFDYTPPAGTVLLAGAGQVLSVAFSPTDTNYTSATATVRINVLKATPSIAWTNPADITYGSALGSGQLNATANVPGSFLYTPPAGTVLPAGAGQVLSVSFSPSDANYSAATATVRVNVLKAAPTITWSNPGDVAYGVALGSGQLNATANVPGSFLYTPPAGTVLSAGAGQVLSVSFSPSDANYSGATASVRVNVLKAAPTITWSNPGDVAYGVALGSGQLNATANVPGSFLYTPPAGTVLSAGAGQVLSVAFSPSDANYSAATATVRINVLKATPSITWTSPTDIAYGVALGSGQLNATANVPGSFLYTPPAGTVLPAGAGQVLSVAFSPSDANYSAATATVRVNVLKAAPTITWSNPGDVAYGVALGSGQLNATANVPGSFLYTPPAGTVLSAGAGQVLSVSFSPSDANYSGATASVRINVLKAAPTITWSNPADVAYGVALGSGQLNATASVPGNFLYTPPAGTVLPVGAGQTLSVVFSPTDTNYAAATASVRVNVLKAGPTITWKNPADITYGTALGSGQLNATASVPGSFLYTPPVGTVLPVGAGQVLSVAFSPSDTNYAGATASVRVNVLKATPLITWTNSVADIPYGTALGSGQLNATASVAGYFVYTPPAGTVLSAGTGQVLVVTFTPANTNYAAATASFRINVLAAPASLRGVATDALTKAPLAGVLVRLGNRTQTTGPDGGFGFTNLTPGGLAASFTADPDSGPAPLAVRFQNASVDGAYTLQAESPGYSVYSYAPLVLAMGEDKQWNFSLSPSLRGLRLVLNWGANPKDLDAHLLTPRIDGVRYHIQYRNRYFGQTNRPPFAQLDADETSGYGPETITIASNAPGIYRYYAHNYQEDQGNTGAFTNSEAVVQIYSTAGLIQTVRVPAVGVGDYWEVCAIDGASGKITLINQIVAREPQPDDSVTIPTGDDPGGDPNEPPQWLWSFGDGLSSDQENPTHVYLTQGVYPVSLQITLPDGRISTSSRPGLITVTGSADGRPRLTIARAGTDVLIRWQATDTGFGLESRADLSTGAWTSVPQLPQTGPGDTNTARIPMSGRQYFRLRK